MVNVPKLPLEDLEFKEKEFMLSVYEDFEKSSKFWFWLLLGVLVLWIPARLFLEKNLTTTFLARIIVPQVNLHPYSPRGLETVHSEIIPVKSGLYSAYIQILNPNPDISARKFSYELSFFDADGGTIKKISGENFALAGTSKFIVLPNIALPAPPANIKADLKDIQWTKYIPKIDPHLEVLQERSGVTPEGNFFAEGLLRNPQSFHIKNIEIVVLQFDKQNKKIIGVNSTRVQDLASGESRYFRVLWPSEFSNYGDTQIIPSIDLFSANFEIDKGQPLPPR